jgi:2-polyprenyl-3-methyl-5-hydroxy-6-metoxy-1,4-benzoquinol methylase
LTDVQRATSPHDLLPVSAGHFERALQRTADRFARATDRPSQRHFTREKLRRDPVARALASAGLLGSVLDVGCGRGQLSLLLLELGLAERVVGCDWDRAKVDLGNRAAEELAARFTTEDVASADLEAADTVLLVDVLHYLDAAKQDALLARTARKVKPGGRLFVREASLGFGWRSAFTSFVERISQAVKFNLGERIAIRHVEREFVPLLEREGMRCRVTPCWSGTPFANVLLTAERPSP